MFKAMDKRVFVHLWLSVRVHPFLTAPVSTQLTQSSGFTGPEGRLQGSEVGLDKCLGAQPPLGH